MAESQSKPEPVMRGPVVPRKHWVVVWPVVAVIVLLGVAIFLLLPRSSTTPFVPLLKTPAGISSAGQGSTTTSTSTSTTVLSFTPIPTAPSVTFQVPTRPPARTIRIPGTKG